MKVAVYARVSTSDQLLDSQMHALTNYAANRKFRIVEVFSDTGVSGAKDRRPGLDRLMDGARKRQFDAILVFRFDRFARSTRHLANALEEFRTLGIQFMSYSENIDTATPMGQAMFTMIGAMAQLERDIIKERIKAGVAAARARGSVLGRPKTTQSVKILELRAQGKSLREIAREVGIGVASVHRVLREDLTPKIPISG